MRRMFVYDSCLSLPSLESVIKGTDFTAEKRVNRFTIPSNKKFGRRVSTECRLWCRHMEKRNGYKMPVRITRTYEQMLL